MKVVIEGEMKSSKVNFRAQNIREEKSNCVTRLVKKVKRKIKSKN